jgi:hypothetical protein
VGAGGVDNPSRRIANQGDCLSRGAVRQAEYRNIRLVQSFCACARFLTLRFGQLEELKFGTRFHALPNLEAGGSRRSIDKYPGYHNPVCIPTGPATIIDRM